jgi:hypothetical protein
MVAPAACFLVHGVDAVAGARQPVQATGRPVRRVPTLAMSSRTLSKAARLAQSIITTKTNAM